MTFLPRDDVRPPAGVVRVPVRMMRPSPVAFAKAVWGFVGGATGSAFTKRSRRAVLNPGRDPSRGVNAMSHAPLALRETGAAYFFDPNGFRLEGSSEVSLAVSWGEVGRVALQVQHSTFLGLKMLRLILWPLYPQSFLAAHPGSTPAWDAELGGCALAVVKATTIPRDSVDLTLAGLAFAGARFDGRVEELPATG
ncbi:hypothetical protein RM572_15400 [Streptomyces sp. DSM 42041]|uniref:Htaa domain-containing protein n=1 Tax=Streptomyces hazeniae TaxID=3075538 RepID=A0ABU2NT33_9ACTN|nr:hypothetical protein [Streptomyces sp. DSM 42041]MDT0380146.1 hypothetical protein [Streptomyces sp. DSM 42041]